MKQNVRGIGVGTISLIMIFSVLCLTIFAMLTLSTSNAEKTLSERSSTFVRGYYEADAVATSIRAQLLDSVQTGFFPGNINGVEIYYEHGDEATYVSYSCRITDVSDLFIRLMIEEATDVVLEWRAGYSGDWESDDSLNLWDPDEFLELFL